MIARILSELICAAFRWWVQVTGVKDALHAEIFKVLAQHQQLIGAVLLALR